MPGLHGMGKRENPNEHTLPRPLHPKLWSDKLPSLLYAEAPLPSMRINTLRTNGYKD